MESDLKQLKQYSKSTVAGKFVYFFFKKLKLMLKENKTMIMEVELENTELSKQDLLALLKFEATKIHITHIMKACNHLISEGKYIQSNYRQKFYDTYIQSFILRIKEIKEDKNLYHESVDIKELKTSLKQLKEQELRMSKLYPADPNFSAIYQIISIYTSFVIDEPIHVVGSEFPGGFKVKYVDGKYLCPVKEKQENNPNAVCGFCIAQQDPEVR